MLKSRREIGEKCEKKRSGRVASRVDISVTNGPIDKRQTRMCREMHGLACAMSLGERHVTRAVHGSSEGHEMLKRNDKYHSIADDVPIPKM